MNGIDLRCKNYFVYTRKYTYTKPTTTLKYHLFYYFIASVKIYAFVEMYIMFLKSLVDAAHFIIQSIKMSHFCGLSRHDWINVLHGNKLFSLYFNLH